MVERREYQLGKLVESELEADPIKQFQIWFEAYTENKESAMNNAAILATSSKSGEPTARTILLKGVQEDGFVFFTNYASTKGKQLAENPQACLVFYWPEWERQVTIRGVIEKVSAEESDEYFKSRPKHAQVAASCSKQSEPIDSRESLESQHQDVLSQYPNDEKVPRPSFWGGYCLKPKTIEFWQGRENRLNDRILYARSGEGWEMGRVQP